jgi:hypothetical protein
MPRSVRLGVLLIASAIAINVLAKLWQRSITSRTIAEVVLMACLFGGLLFAIAYRRNWARLTFAFVWVIAIVFAIVFVTRPGPLTPVLGAVSIAVAVLQGIGLVLLFTREASAWYHPSKPSSLTSA